jgi:PKD repeat protein
VQSVAIDFGDGSSPVTLPGKPASASHTYTTIGSFSVRATVRDASGDTSSATVSVIVSPPPLTLAITPPTTAPGAGLPATFAIVPGVPANSGFAIRNVRVDWGDGSAPQDLGAISASTNVVHVFDLAGSYAVKATATDTSGNSISVSSFVTVIPVASPTINITPSVPINHSTTMTVSFTIQVSAPTGVNITDASIDYGDGAVDTLGGVNGTVIKTHPYTQPSGYSTVVKVTVKDSLGRTTQGTASITLP